jgi:hypothetical protein
VRKVIEGVAEQIASGDKKVEVLKKVDLSIVDGIVRTAKAYNISDILISYKAQQGNPNKMFGNIAGNLLSKSRQSIIISKILQPLTSFQRVLVVLTPNSELEDGFKRSAIKINCLLRQLGDETFIYGTEATLNGFCNVINDKRRAFYKYTPVVDYEQFEQLNDVRTDDLFVFLNARKQTLSYDYHLDEMSRKLSRNNEFTSFVVFYPDISKTLQDSLIGDITGSPIEQNYEKVRQLTGKITGIFKREEEDDETPTGSQNH